MAKKKKLRKAVESLQKRIDEHKEKIEKYEGKNEYVGEYWKKEIGVYEKQRAEREARLRKRK